MSVPRKTTLALKRAAEHRARERAKDRANARSVQEAANKAAEKVGLKTILPELQRRYGSDGSVPVGEAHRYDLNPNAAAEYMGWKVQRVSAAIGAAGLSAVSRLLVVELSEREKQVMPKEITTEAVKAEAKAEAATSKRSTEDVETPHGSFRKGTIMHAIYRSFQLKDGLTQAEIVERLVKEFPDRDPAKMAVTVGIQVNRMPKERGFELGRDDAGRYSIHIKGRSTVRNFSPEVVAKREAAAKAKAEAAAAKAKADAAAAKAKADAAPPKGPEVVGKLGAVATTKKGGKKK